MDAGLDMDVDDIAMAFEDAAPLQDHDMSMIQDHDTSMRQEEVEETVVEQTDHVALGPTMTDLFAGGFVSSFIDHACDFSSSPSATVAAASPRSVSSSIASDAPTLFAPYTPGERNQDLAKAKEEIALDHPAFSSPWSFYSFDTQLCLNSFDDRDDDLFEKAPTAAAAAAEVENESSWWSSLIGTLPFGFSSPASVSAAALSSPVNAIDDATIVSPASSVHTTVILFAFSVSSLCEFIEKKSF